MLKVFAERLLKARSPRTQAEAAEIMGITPQRLHNYECGKREPDLQILKRFVEVYGVSADWLLGVDNCDLKNMTFNERLKKYSALQTPATSEENSRLLDIIESQQRVIENLSKLQK